MIVLKHDPQIMLLVGISMLTSIIKLFETQQLVKKRQLKPIL